MNLFPRFRKTQIMCLTSMSDKVKEIQILLTLSTKVIVKTSLSGSSGRTMFSTSQLLYSPSTFQSIRIRSRVRIGPNQDSSSSNSNLNERLPKAVSSRGPNSRHLWESRGNCQGCRVSSPLPTKGVRFHQRVGRRTRSEKGAHPRFKSLCLRNARPTWNSCKLGSATRSLPKPPLPTKNLCSATTLGSGVMTATHAFWAKRVATTSHRKNPERGSERAISKTAARQLPLIY